MISSNPELPPGGWNTQSAIFVFYTEIHFSFKNTCYKIQCLQYDKKKKEIWSVVNYGDENKKLGQSITTARLQSLKAMLNVSTRIPRVLVGQAMKDANRAQDLADSQGLWEIFRVHKREKKRRINKEGEKRLQICEILASGLSTWRCSVNYSFF